MADHQIATRLYNLWTGFIALWVTKTENEHPEIAYQNSIQSMTQRYTEVKRAAGQLIARRDDLQAQHDTASQALAQASSELDAAVSTNQDDLALILIQRKNSLTSTLAQLAPQVEAAQREADSIKSDLLDIQGQIAALKTEQTQMLAQFKSAKARLQVQGMLDGLSVDAEVQALTSVREHIKGVVGQANLGAELRSNDLEVRMKQLSRTAAPIAARAELAQLKAARQAASSVPAGTKTL